VPLDKVNLCLASLNPKILCDSRKTGDLKFPDSKIACDNIISLYLKGKR
jgi:hypothetical protein